MTTTKFVQQTLRVVLVALLTLSLSVLSHNGYARQIKPMGEDTPPPTTTGPRGPECESSDLNLKLLSKPDRISSLHPSFSWVVEGSEDTKVELKVRLKEQSNTNRRNFIVPPTKLLKKPGQITFTLNSDLPGLSLGKSYVWQVHLLCDAERPEGEVISDKHEFRVVDVTSSLESPEAFPMRESHG